jgi:hypothetical protein
MRVPFLSASLSPGFGRGLASCGLFVCLALAGCSKQGEGERCDQNNGNLDCETNLVCKGEAQLGLQGNTRGIGLCCPASNESAVDACRVAAMLRPEPDAGLIEETPAPPEPTPDAGAQPDAAAPAP